MRDKRLAVLGFWFFGQFGCAGTSSGGGTQTNWVECRTDDDCSGSQVCVEEVCRDRPAIDAGQRDSATADAPGSGTAWLPPPGPYNCELLEPVTFLPGDGQCAPPPIPAPTYCRNTCADQPGAPGPEACLPSVIEEFARCCYPGGCGYDDGNECRSFADLSDETVASALPCAASSTTPERIYEGLFDRIVLTQDSIVIGTFRGNDAASVTYIAKDTCAATEVYSMATVWDLTATDEAAYVIGYDAATSEAPVLAVSPTGIVTKVPLVELFDPYTIEPVNLVASGTSAYVIVRAQQSDTEATWAFAIAEIPCCGSPPRIVADSLPGWETIGDSGVMTNAAMEGQTLVLAGYDATLDVNRGKIAGVFDFNANQATLFFDFFHGSLDPFAVADGRLYLGSGDRIVAMGTADCSLTTVATRPTANGITALAVDGGDVFWAETYSNVAGARILMKRGDGTETRLAQVHDNVDWIGVDSQNVYWSMQPVSGPWKALARRRRP